MLSMISETLYSVPFPMALGIVSTIAVPITLYLKSLLGPVETTPYLYYKASQLNNFVIDNTKRLTQPYLLPRWTKNKHVQTVLHVFLRGPELIFKREMLDLKDAGVLALDWAMTGVETLRKSSPIVIVVPGLTGKADDYTFLCKCAVEKGFRPVVFNKRGHGNSPLTTPKMQSFGDPYDFREAVLHIRQKFPGVLLTGVGISAGSGLLASYLGEYALESTYIEAAVFNCPGYDSETLFGQLLKNPYSYILLRNLKKLVASHRDVLSQAVDMDKVMKSATLNAFDENFYCKIYGHPSLSEYWRLNNPMRYINRHCTPFLSINSNDDPVCVKEIVPRELFTQKPDFILATTDYGGHCGFIEYPGWNSWADKLAVEYLITVLDYLKTTK